MNYHHPPTTLGDQLPGSSTDTKPPESGTDSPRSSHVLYSAIGTMGLWKPRTEHNPELKPPPGFSAVGTNSRDRYGDKYWLVFPHPPSNLGIENVTVVPEEDVTNNFQWPEVPMTTTYTIGGDSPVGQIEVTPITKPAIPDEVLSKLSKAYPGTFEAWKPAEIRFVARDRTEQTPAQSACDTKLSGHQARV
jgi:hypothetical protein